MKNDPTVSVIMTAFNAEAWIDEAIISILNQSYADFEFIIFNDGSTDETDTRIRSFHDERIRYIRCTENKGIAFRANQGLLIANGKYIARFDADDKAHPNRLALQVAAFEKDQDLTVCASWCDFLTESGLKTERCISPMMTDEEIPCVFLKGENPIVQSATMFQKEIALRAGGYDEDLSVCEDFDLLIRIALHGGSMRILHYPLVSIRERVSAHSFLNKAECEGVSRRIVRMFYARLGVLDPDAIDIVRTFFENSDAFVHSIDRKKWAFFLENIQTLFQGLNKIYVQLPGYNESFIEKMEERFQEIKVKVAGIARLAVHVRNPDFACRLTPERRIQIEEAVFLDGIFKQTHVCSELLKKKDVRYV
jgi:glycosyltransferase involved in cell wall biosynthesis